MRLRGKTAIVTGGAHGIGRAIAERFAAEGAAVFIADIDSAAGVAAAVEITRAGGRASFQACDVAVPQQVSAFVDAVLAQTSRVDVLCNNAAFLGRWHAASEASDDEWEKCFRVSLLGSQHFTRAVLPSMISGRSGSIINIGSVQGLVAGRQSAAYTAVKHALTGFTRSVACDYGVHNVRCNCICPGAIQTRISPQPGEELYERQVSKTFLGRVGQPHEIATVAAFLASDNASYITGAILPVDGGWTAM